MWTFAQGAPTLDTNFQLYPATAALFHVWQVTYDYGWLLPTHISSNFASEVETIIGGELLTNLSDAGTAIAFDAEANNMSASSIDAFFTDLPTASYTATLDFQNNPGSSTCTTSIATDKGYTVIT